MYAVVDLRLVHYSLEDAPPSQREVALRAARAYRKAKREVEGIELVSLRADAGPMSEGGAGAYNRVVTVRVEIGPVRPAAVGARASRMIEGMIVQDDDYELSPLSGGGYRFVARSVGGTIAEAERRESTTAAETREDSTSLPILDAREPDTVTG